MPSLETQDRPAWIDACLAAARPQALAALTRYFRDLDCAEEAYQEASLRALKTWPSRGKPDDPVAWLIFVGRNHGLDQKRRVGRWEALPTQDPPLESSDGAGEDIESVWVDSLEREEYRDDILRLLFVCCHPGLPPAQQIALALRIVTGMSVAEIARAFLVSTRAMEKRITRAKQRIARDAVPFATPLRRRARSPPGERLHHDLPALQRGLLRHRRPEPRPRHPVRRGDPAGPLAPAPLPQRGRDHGSSGPVFASAFAQPRPDR